MAGLRRRNPIARLVVTALALLSVLAGCETTPSKEAPTPRDGKARENAQLQTQLGISYMRQGKLERALQRFQSAETVDPTYAPTQNALGLLYERLRQPQEAGRRYRRATELDPTFASARNNYGGWLCRTGEFAEAEAQFRAAAENPLYDVPHLALFNAGVCMQRKGDNAAAMKYFRRCLDRNPKFSQSLYALSALNLTEKNYLSARAYFQRYLEVGQHTPKTLWLGIRIERILGDKNAVSSYSMLLRRKYPDSKEAQRLRVSDRQ